MTWQAWPVVLLAALALSPGPAVTEICFRHAGPQDKPMPGFCVCAPGAPPGVSAIQPDAAAWEALRALVDTAAQPEPGYPVPPGLYRLRLLPGGGIRYLPPGGMRQLAALLLASPGLTVSQAQMLQRLQARLN